MTDQSDLQNIPLAEFHLPLSLVVKLGSIAVHTDELLSEQGHAVDKTVLEGLLVDPEVTQWIKQMGPLLPLKRNLPSKT